MSLTDQELGLALHTSLTADVEGRAAGFSARSMLPAIHQQARRRRQRRRLAAGVAAGCAVVTAAAVIVGPLGDAAHRGGVNHSAPASGSPGLGFVPGSYGGVIADGLPPKLALHGPVATVPLLPGAVKWGADAATLTTLSRRLYGTRPDGTIPDDNPALLDRRNARWVAFPLPSSALLQPKDLGRSRMYVSADSVQTTGVLPGGADPFCAPRSPAWQVHRRAGASLTLSTDGTGPTGLRVVESAIVLDPSGVASARTGATATIRCTGPSMADLLTPVSVDAGPGVWSVAGVHIPALPSGDPSRFVGVAQVGQLVVEVELQSWSAGSTAGSAASLTRQGEAALQAAARRLQAGDVRELVQRYGQ